ncbi:unnamed protein product [marine sediment metagenome]|uniref:Uncharacterized protein n=1 Tax=marine sediment metagenome TaxID=412755 RepID=X1R6G3_9ZZZZ
MTSKGPYKPLKMLISEVDLDYMTYENSAGSPGQAHLFMSRLPWRF